MQKASALVTGGADAACSANEPAGEVCRALRVEHLPPRNLPPSWADAAATLAGERQP
jgi:hypothetical protein